MKDTNILGCACMLLLSGMTDAAGLEDIEHIVVFMQENRAFDHYYGTMKGVRGFNDRSAPMMENKKNPFFQPYNGTDFDFLLPFHVSLKNTSATCMSAPAMSYNADIRMWNEGKMNAWNTARDPGFGMAHFNREDLPYYYALGDNFLVGDMYYQSTFTQTNPNRFHLFSGSNGLSVNSTHNILDDKVPLFGVNWITMAEVLENSKISWKVYQQLDNFNDNGFEWFEQFRTSLPGSALFDKGLFRSFDLVEEFKKDLIHNTLPAVSWIIAPAHLSEHAQHHPQDGEDLSSRLIKLLSLPEAKEAYSKTAFILNYDEGGQFYDHLWTPTPPTSEKDGKSTVTTVGEITKDEQFNIPKGNPIGPGFRVPLFIVSPWTRKDGGIIYSEVTDHTSVLKLIEKRFNVSIPNISPWRRAVMGDLINAFDFQNPDYSFPVMPDTSNNTKDSKKECDSMPPPQLPKVQVIPTQEQGTKVSRALPYYFDVSDSVVGNTVTISMKNVGPKTGSSPAAVFHVYDYLSLSSPPRKYTIEQSKMLQDSWDMNSNHYNLSLHGPNGFVRTFASSGRNDFVIEMVEVSDKNSVQFSAKCVSDSGKCSGLVIKDMAYGEGTHQENGFIKFGEKVVKTFNISKSGNWYDFSIRNSESSFERRFMGRLETGKDSITDPAMAVSVSKTADPFPQKYRNYVENSFKSTDGKSHCENNVFGFVKDVCFKLN